MSKLRKNPVQEKTKQGDYVSHHPLGVEYALRKKPEDPTGIPELDSIINKLPKIFRPQMERILQSANLTEFTALEKLDRAIPLIDIKQLPWFFGCMPLAVITAYLAAHSEASANGTMGEIFNIINEKFRFFGGKSYPNGATWGLASTAFFGAGIAKGVIPWRGDQIGFKKSWREEEKKRIEEGIEPYSGVGHIVGYGMRDPLIYSELEGQSFLRSLREQFGEVVLLQRKGPYWKPGNLGLDFNDKNIYANIETLSEKGTPMAEALSNVIVSGAYKAGGIIINGQREHELFEKISVDSQKYNETKRDRLDLSLGSHLVKNANLLRELIYKEAPPIKVSIVIPQHLSQKPSQLGNNENPWASTIKHNFLQPEYPEIHGVIIPEQVFLNMVVKELEKKELLNVPIYIDAEGEKDAENKARRCVQSLQKLYQEKGATCDIRKNPTEAQVSILLRHNNRNIDATSSFNRDEYGHDWVFYPTTSRKDTVRHTGENRRVAIPYKAEIARLINEHLSGTENEYSLKTHLKKGRLEKL